MMDDVLGYTAWRWLFFVEGALTVAVAILALYILPDFPETKSISWLTPAEHELAKRRMIEDTAVSESSERSNGVIADLVIALTDWKVWYIALTLFFSVISTSFFMYFPTLTSTMGYNPTITLLLCAPPWLVTAAWALWVCRHSDRTGERCMHVILPFIGGIGGFLLAMSTMNTAIRYISLQVFFPFLLAHFLITLFQVSDGAKQCWCLLFPCMDVIDRLQPSGQTCRCTCFYQRHITEWEHCWIIRLGEGVGSNVQEVIRDLHCSDIDLHHDVSWTEKNIAAVE